VVCLDPKPRNSRIYGVRVELIRIKALTRLAVCCFPPVRSTKSLFRDELVGLKFRLPPLLPESAIGVIMTHEQNTKYRFARCYF
jgi:hypothetical protein